MRIRHLLALALIGPLASACTANPVFPDHDDELVAEVVFSAEHLATLTEFIVTVHVEDGRHFLETRQQRYDLITGEPPPPKVAGIVNLFTKEYFAAIRARERSSIWHSFRKNAVSLNRKPVWRT